MDWDGRGEKRDWTRTGSRIPCLAKDLVLQEAGSVNAAGATWIAFFSGHIEARGNMARTQHGESRAVKSTK